MARRALSSQCRVITAMVILAVLAIISYPHQLDTGNSAKFSYRRDASAVSGAATAEQVSSEHLKNVTLAKRAMAPYCDVETAFVFVARGCHLTNLMFQTQAQVVAQYPNNGVSKFITGDALGSSSMWKRNTDVNFDPDIAYRYLFDLNDVEGFQSRTRIKRDQQWVLSSYKQDRPYSRLRGAANVFQDRVDHMPTYGFHEQVTSTTVNAAVIIILNAWDPAFMTGYRNNGVVAADDDLPEVGYWSDIGFIEFSRLGHFGFTSPEDFAEADPPRRGAFRRPPKWILVPLVWGPNPTLTVISHCLISYGLTSIPTWENRVTFPIGSFCFEAILGTQHGTSLAWFLINHKYRFGKATLLSVTIFGSGAVSPVNGYDIPSMLWYLRPTNVMDNAGRTIAQIRADNNAWAMGAGNDPQNAPHMLRPIYW